MLYISWIFLCHISQKTWASLVAQLVNNPAAMQKTPVQCLGQEDSLKKGSLPTPVFLGFPGGSNLPLMGKRPGFDPWVGKIPWSRAWQSTPVFLPGESHGRRSLVGYSPWGHKELDMTERLSTAQPSTALTPHTDHPTVSTTQKNFSREDLHKPMNTWKCAQYH